MSIELNKDLPSMKLINDWYNILLPPSELDFIALMLKGLLILSQKEFDWAILQNLLARWYVNTCTFHFGASELALAYEEYLRFTNFTHRQGILPLPLQAFRDLPLLFRMPYASLHHVVASHDHLLINNILAFRESPYIPSEGHGQASARAFILLFTRTFYPHKSSSLYMPVLYILLGQFCPNLLGQTYFGIAKICNRAQMWIKHNSVPDMDKAELSLILLVIVTGVVHLTLEDYWAFSASQSPSIYLTFHNVDTLKLPNKTNTFSDQKFANHWPIITNVIEDRLGS